MRKVLLSFLLAVLASVVLLSVPSYSQLSDHQLRHATLAGVNGPKVYFLLSIPVVLAGMPLLLRARAVLAVAAVLLVVCVLIGFASVGLFYLPSAILQGLVLSDIRQAIFSRPNNPPVSYLWLADEAQNFFLTRQQQENMADVLTMARSFGSYFFFLCQNISTAIPDSRILETLHTNIRWSLTLRGTPRDAQFLRAALPVTGSRPRPEPHPFRERTSYSPEEERSLALEGIAHLPDRTGYLWLKTRSPEAIKIETPSLELPQGEEFRGIVEALRAEPNLGKRIARSEYETRIVERDREWLELKEESSDLGERFEKKYQDERAGWQA